MSTMPSSTMHRRLDCVLCASAMPNIRGATGRALLLPLVVLQLLAPRAMGIDNGIGITRERSLAGWLRAVWLSLAPSRPRALAAPRGWRSWNLFHDQINTSVMEAQMMAVLDKTRSVNGTPTALAELGFDWISMVRLDLHATCHTSWTATKKCAVTESIRLLLTLRTMAGSVAIAPPASRRPPIQLCHSVRTARRAAASGMTATVNR
eukprot:COSAG06_NODE_4120_length_4550_cov_1.804314_1_plen_207_part_00